jgi:hypothetical protein
MPMGRLAQIKDRESLVAWPGLKECVLDELAQGGSAALPNSKGPEPLQYLAMVRSKNREFLLFLAQDGSFEKGKGIVALLVA